MQNKKKSFIGQKKVSGNKGLLQLLSIALSILLALQVANFFSNFTEVFGPGYRADADSMFYSIQDGEYWRLRSKLGAYSQKEIERNETFLECYHVALYFENSMMYYAFLDIDPAQAEFYQEAAAENAANMGDLAYQKEVIDTMLAEAR